MIAPQSIFSILWRIRKGTLSQLKVFVHLGNFFNLTKQHLFFNRKRLQFPSRHFHIPAMPGLTRVFLVTQNSDGFSVDHHRQSTHSTNMRSFIFSTPSSR